MQWCFCITIDPSKLKQKFKKYICVEFYSITFNINGLKQFVKTESEVYNFNDFVFILLICGISFGFCLYVVKVVCFWNIF